MAFKKKDANPMMIDGNTSAPAPAAPAAKEKKSKAKFLEPNEMNFYEQYKVVVEGKKKDVDLTKILKPLIALLLVVLAAFILLEVVLIGFKAKNKSLDKYINDPANIAAYNEALAVKEETETIKTKTTNMVSLINAIDSYPNVGKDFFTAIANTATKNGVTITSYGYVNDNGFLTLSCTSTSTAGISQFVRDLGTLNLFNKVMYNGFQGDQGSYGFTVSAVCLGDANAQVPAAEQTAENAEAETNG